MPAAPSPLTPVLLDLSGERFTAVYRIDATGPEAERTAEHLVVEQTIEFPIELVPDDDIRHALVGRIEDLTERDDGTSELVVSFAVELVAGLFTQLLNVLFGNISMVPGVRLTDVILTDATLSGFPGPRLGIPGLRRLLDRPNGPLFATALKPMGSPVESLAEFAHELSAGGIELIKEDHSFATQPFHPFEVRVPALARAVRRGAEERAGKSIFLPALNVERSDVGRAIELAVDAGAGGVLVLPGLTGYGTIGWIVENTPEDFVVQAHPAFLGSFVTSPTCGIAHGVLFGTLPRLAGADVSIFPNFGGRFSFPKDACADIGRRCRETLGAIAPVWPAPAGGMHVETVNEIIDFYGPDTIVLIGGDLYRGSIRTRTRRMVDAALRT